jgi:hypothetical protein
LVAIYARELNIMIDTGNLKPATVLVMGGGASFTDQAIEIGAVFDGEPAAQHVAVVHHVGPAGVLWGIEGRPGGVGWVDCAKYVKSPLTVANTGQPITEEARMSIAVLMESMLGTPYDWAAIAEDGGMIFTRKFGLADIWHEKVNGVLPGHVVCSALAAYGYDRCGQPAPLPGDYRHVTPSDWLRFIIDHGYGT